MGFRALLTERQKKANTRTCIGLDPNPEKLPECLRGMTSSLALDVKRWMWKIVVETAPFASMFKPQSAHWLGIPGGVEALSDLVSMIHGTYPDIPVFLDCKPGDIDRTQQKYRKYAFEIIGADGMNFTPYMGDETMSALADKSDLGKAIVAVCYTSNKGGRRFQDALMQDGRPLWEHVAEWTLQDAEKLGVLEDAGLVMAAAYKASPKQMEIKASPIYFEHLYRARKIVGDKLWFLIPGVGAQGGFVEQTVIAADAGPGSYAINSSSGITEASSGTDYAQAAASKAEELRNQINDAL